MHETLGIDRVVLVQPSVYGADNSCLLDALSSLGDRARGVVVLSGAETRGQLEEMHAAGVRGVRLNLESDGTPADAALLARLERTAEAIAPLGWHVQLFTNLTVVALLAAKAPALPAALVFDHFALARPALGAGQPGFDALVGLVESGRAYVKLSAPHRLKDNDADAVAAVARLLASAGPAQVLWGTDWPHTPQLPLNLGDDRIEPFDRRDEPALLASAIEWMGSQTQVERLLVDNPARLYDFSGN
jgi:predicted TIM-barrel fold metal-dependent hydrolase